MVSLDVTSRLCLVSRVSAQQGNLYNAKLYIIQSQQTGIFDLVWKACKRHKVRLCEGTKATYSDYSGATQKH